VDDQATLPPVAAMFMAASNRPKRVTVSMI
jgi:hypothetical protein